MINLLFNYFNKSIISKLSILLVILAVVAIALGFSKASAKTVTQEKHFVSITIEEGDTLWSIAEENISPEYDDINDYIKEVMRTNCLSSTDITAGRHIIIPRYVR
ncbi:MAG: LysM peptidoglycan-binding domain-containing protein [Lachnospiraceae bacterium]|nr:LysM peptidoglycan-binding domain-containing protein [Lachnospiraceae bacterium]